MFIEMNRLFRNQLRRSGMFTVNGESTLWLLGENTTLLKELCIRIVLLGYKHRAPNGAFRT